MVTKEKLNRINELAKKKKLEGLTAEEQQERKRLHEEYIQAVRDSLRSQLDVIHFVDDKEEMTEEERENVAYLTEKLGKEYEEHEKIRKQLEETLEGNPGNPIGEAGADMLQRMNTSHKKETDWGLDMLKDLNPKNILDIGCGGGATIANLHERYPEATIYGIDISDVAVNQTIELNRTAVVEDKVRVSNSSVENLPYGDDFFDLVISVNSYFFWVDFTKALKQIKRVLKDNGTVEILGDVYKGVELTESEKKIDSVYGLKLMSPEELKKAFLVEGFKDIDVSTKQQEHWICVIGKK